MAVIVFCVWHMFAIAAYVAPQNTASARWNTFAIRSFNAARPYVLGLSQWQKWDIFSPDPLRRVSLYSIEVYRNDAWRSLKTLDFQHLPASERAKELKILGRLEDSWKGMTETYLQDECIALPEAAGLQLRLNVRSYVLPKTLAELAVFSTTVPQVTETVLGSVTCPSLPS